MDMGAWIEAPRAFHFHARTSVPTAVPRKRGEPRVSVQNHASAGGKKSRPGRMCRSWGPKYLRRQSEIKAGLLAWTARVRSGRDHPDREHVDHRNGSKHPVCSSFPLPVHVAHCRALGKKRRPSLRQKGAEWSVGARSSTCVGAGEARSPTCLFALSTLVPAQPPGPGVRVQRVPHLGQQAGRGAVRPA